MAERIQVRRDTAANWASVNPTLATGEIGFETDTGKFKFGTGAAAWNSLAYASADIAAALHAAAGKTTPVDADELGIADSAASWGLKKLTFANLKAWIAGLFVSRTAAAIESDITVTGTGLRFKADFSNATVASRYAFQTTTANSGTNLHLVPNGTVATANGTAHMRFEDTNSLTGSGSFGGVLLVQDTDFRIQSNRTGSGTYLPITTYVGGFKNTDQPAAGGFLVTGGIAGYGVGQGGTVTQATSKTTAVTLNKPSGVITMANDSLAAAALATFTLNNSAIGANDTVAASAAGFAGPYRVTVGNVAAGSCQITVQNNNAGALSDALKINFSVNRVATT